MAGGAETAPQVAAAAAAAARAAAARAAAAAAAEEEAAPGVVGARAAVWAGELVAKSAAATPVFHIG